MRQVHYCDLNQDGARLELRISANGFLHRMVRTIVGALVTIDRGEIGRAQGREGLAAWGLGSLRWFRVSHNLGPI